MAERDGDAREPAGGGSKWLQKLFVSGAGSAVVVAAGLYGAIRAYLPRATASALALDGGALLYAVGERNGGGAIAALGFYEEKPFSVAPGQVLTVDVPRSAGRLSVLVDSEPILEATADSGRKSVFRLLDSGDHLIVVTASDLGDLKYDSEVNFSISQDGGAGPALLGTYHLKSSGPMDHARGKTLRVRVK